MSDISKWFFAVNEPSLTRDPETWEAMILTAVESARQNTSLDPHLIFDGDENNNSFFFQKLRSLGVKILTHRVSFFEELKSFSNGNEGLLQILSGAFLRVEIPLIEAEAEFILYTDCDVMFEQNPKLTNLKPEYFSCAPEFDKENYSDFNTGVMIMNLPRLRHELPAFIEFIRHNLARLHTFDQDAYRLYYGNKADQLPLEMNWKPYWGASSLAEIVHFHGPKPLWARRLMANPEDRTIIDYHTIYHWNISGYEYYLPKWLNTAAQAGVSI
jgi:hypothetical protein